MYFFRLTILEYKYFFIAHVDKPLMINSRLFYMFFTESYSLPGSKMLKFSYLLSLAAFRRLPAWAALVTKFGANPRALRPFPGVRRRRTGSLGTSRSSRAHFWLILGDFWEKINDFEFSGFSTRPSGGHIMGYQTREKGKGHGKTE